MESSSPPRAPNASKMIKQATESNKETGARNFENSLVNQETPFGSVGYTQDPVTKRWTANQEFNPEQQHLLETYQAAGGSMNEAGKSWADFIKGMDPNFDLSNTSIDSTILDAYRPEYQENYDEQRRRRTDELANKGLKEGSDGFIEAMRDFDMNQGDVWSRLQRDARSQAISQMLAERNQPFNESASIHSQMQLPQGMSFVNTPTYSEPFVDTAGVTMQGYNSAMQAYEAKQAQKNAMMSGLFQLGGTAIGAIAGGPIGASIGGSLGSSFGGGWANGGTMNAGRTISPTGYSW